MMTDENKENPRRCIRCLALLKPDEDGELCNICLSRPKEDEDAHDH